MKVLFDINVDIAEALQLLRAANPAYNSPRRYHTGRQ